MFYFSLFINFIESILISIFSCYFFDLRQKKAYISSVTIVLFFIVSYAQFILQNSGLWLSISVVLIVVLSLIFSLKKFKFEFLYISVIYHIFILLFASFSYSLFSFINKLIHISSDSFFILFCSTAKILQLVFTFYILKKKIKIMPALDYKHWRTIFYIDMFLFVGLVISGYALIEKGVSTLLYELLVLIFIAITLLFRYTINKIEILNAEKIKAIKAEEQNRFTEKQYLMLKHLKGEIDVMNHRLNYVLMQIKNYLKTDQRDLAIETIDKYIEIVNKFNLVADTGNSVFDCLFSLKINELIGKQISVKTSIFIQKKDTYNDLKFIKMLMQLLDFFSQCNYVYISLQENNCFLTIKIIYRDGKIDLEQLEKFLISSFPDKNKFIIDEHNTNRIRFVINMEKYYGENDYSS